MQCIVGYCYKYSRATYDWFCAPRSQICRWCSHDKVSLPCVFVSDSSASEGGGSACRRCHMGTVSLRCGSVREPSGEPPETMKVEDEVHLLCIIQKHILGRWLYLDEARAAGFTFVWFFSWVDPWVCLQIGRSVELRSTHATAVRFLSCYNTPVLKCKTATHRSEWAPVPKHCKCTCVDGLVAR